MRRSFKHVTSALLVVTAVTFVGPGSHGQVSAAQAVDPSTLIPPPPPEFNPVCKAVGVQTICDVTFNDPPVVAEPSGIVCGSGANAFEALDTSNRSVDGKRYYNAEGKLTERHFHDMIVGHLTNPLTGATVPYTQHDTTLHRLAVAGDISTGTEALAVHLRWSTPQGGTVLIDTGRTIVADPDGTILFDAGQHPLDAFFAFGQADALQPICDALG